MPASPTRSSSSASQVFRSALQTYGISLKGGKKSDKAKGQTAKVEGSGGLKNSAGSSSSSSKQVVSSANVQTSAPTNPFLEPHKYNKGPAPQPKVSKDAKKTDQEGPEPPKKIVNNPEVSQCPKLPGVDSSKEGDVPNEKRTIAPDSTEEIQCDGSAAVTESVRVTTDVHEPLVQDATSNKECPESSKRMSEKKVRAPLPPPPAKTSKIPIPANPDVTSVVGKATPEHVNLTKNVKSLQETTAPPPPVKSSKTPEKDKGVSSTSSSNAPAQNALSLGHRVHLPSRVSAPCGVPTANGHLDNADKAAETTSTSRR